MSGPEFAAWRAYDTIAPLGDQRLARQSALTSAILANIHRAPNQSIHTIDDFDLYRNPVALTREEEEERFRAAWMKAGLVVTHN